MFSLCLFVCLLAELCKTTLLIFRKFGRKVVRGPWKNLIDFGGNADHVTLWL